MDKHVSRRDGYKQCGMGGKIIYRRRTDIYKDDTALQPSTPSSSDIQVCDLQCLPSAPSFRGGHPL